MKASAIERRRAEAKRLRAEDRVWAAVHAVNAYQAAKRDGLKAEADYSTGKRRAVGSHR